MPGGQVLQQVTSNIILTTIILTTSCSGKGCAEMVLPTLAKSLQTFGIAPSVAPYSATDVDATCQRMLSTHKEESRPQRIFSDLLERNPWDVRERLEAQGAKARELLAQRVSPANTCHMDKAGRDTYRKAQVQRLGKMYVEAINKELTKLDFGAIAAKGCWCKAHHTLCNSSPPCLDGSISFNDPAERTLHAEINGTTCVAWS